MKQHFSIIRILATGFFLLISLILVNSFDRHWDLTKDKRYTLHPLAKQMSRSIGEPIYITVYLEGNVPASFRNYKDYIDYYVTELRRYNRDIDVQYRNPSEGDPSEVADFRKFLAEQGIDPIRREVKSTESLSQSLLYPYISIHDSKQLIFVNLLEPQTGRGEEEDLVVSQLAFEGKFLRAIRRLTLRELPQVHIIGTNNQLLAEGYNRDARLGGYRYVASDAETLLAQKDSVGAILAVMKKRDLKREELLAIDLLGGETIPVIWLIDKFDVTLDSLRESGRHLAISREYSIEDYLFSKGVRMTPSLIMDMQCGQIPQVVNESGGNVRTALMRYPFHPLFIPQGESPYASKINSPAAFYYVSPIELLEFPDKIKKEVLLTTGPYTSARQTPVPLDFSFLQKTADPADYEMGRQVTGVHITGPTLSYFKNRLTQSDKSLLNLVNIKYEELSQEINQIVIADADFALPARGAGGGFFPVGYNPAEGFMYEGNTLLLSNLLESLIFGNEILRLSAKKSALRLLDLPKYMVGVTKYRLVLIVLPLVTLLLLYLFYHWFRKRKYVRSI